MGLPICMVPLFRAMVRDPAAGPVAEALRSEGALHSAHGLLLGCVVLRCKAGIQTLVCLSLHQVPFLLCLGSRQVRVEGFRFLGAIALPLWAEVFQ